MARTPRVALLHVDAESRVSLAGKESMLASSAGFLRSVVDASPNPIFVKDGDGRFVLVNQAIASLYGTTVEAMLGKRDADFRLTGNEADHLVANDREAMG